jgi:WD40 repeat protein
MVYRWSVETGSALMSLGHGGRNAQFGFAGLVTTDGKTARICFDYDRCVEYDLESGKERTYGLEFPKDGGAHSTPTALSPDGKTFAELNMFGRIALWNAVEGTYTRMLEPSSQPYTAFAFTPDGKTIVVGDSAHTFRVFDLATGKESRTFGPLEGNVVVRMAISQDGKWLVTAGGKKADVSQPPISKYDPFLRVWDLEKGTEVRTLEFPEDNGCWSLAFTPDSRNVLAAVSGSRNGSFEAVRSWDLATGNAGRAWTDESMIGSALTVSPDGKRLATMNPSGVIRFWDMETGKEHKPLAASPSAVEAVCFRPDGKTLLTVGDDGAVREWDAATGKLLELRRGPVKGCMWALWRFGPGGKMLTGATPKVADSGPGAIDWVRVDDLTTGKRLKAQPGYNQVMTSDGKRMAVRVGDDRINVIDIETEKVFQTLKEKNPIPGESYPSPLGFTPDSKSLIIRTRESVSIWDVRSAEKKMSWHLPKNPIKQKPAEKSFSWERIERIVVSADGTKIGLAGLEDKDQPGRAGASDWNSYVLILEAATGKLLHRIDLGTVSIGELAFSPDAKVLAGAGVWTVHLWDVASGKSLAQFEAHRGRVKSLAFSPDGKRLASASEDSTVLIWDCSK